MDGHTHVNTNASYAFTTCNSNKHINLNANRYVHHLKTTFISGSNRADCMYRAVVSRGAGQLTIFHTSCLCRAVGRSENLRVPVVIRWA